MHTKLERLLSKWLTTLEVMTYYHVVHTAPDQPSHCICTLIIIIIIIVLKGAIWEFYSLLTAPWTVSNTYPQVAKAQLCANHMQHIERFSHAICHVAHAVKGQLSYNVWQSWNHIWFRFILLVETITRRRRGGNRTTWTNPADDELQKMPHTKALKCKSQPRLEP